MACEVYVFFGFFLLLSQISIFATLAIGTNVPIPLVLSREDYFCQAYMLLYAFCKLKHLGAELKIIEDGVPKEIKQYLEKHYQTEISEANQIFKVTTRKTIGKDSPFQIKFTDIQQSISDDGTTRGVEIVLVPPEGPQF